MKRVDALSLRRERAWDGEVRPLLQREDTAWGKGEEGSGLSSRRSEMTINKLDAEAAIKALNGGKAAEIFSLIQGNQHATEKHFSKASALEAAIKEGHPQGYFKRLTLVHFASKQDLGREGLSEKTKERALAEVKAKKPSEFGKKLGRREISIPERHAAQKDDIFRLIYAVIGSPTCELRENNVQADRRFLAVAPIPEGFYGRSINAQDQKATDCDKAVVIVDASHKINPKIVTIFPANNQYVNARPLLT
jgi:hypothetical protein